MTPAQSSATLDLLQQAFRDAMRNVAAPVSVVTTWHDDRPHGSTVSAFASLSMSPPMLLLSLDVTSSLLAHVGLGSRLGVNVLAAHQDQIALRFAQHRPDKFDGVAWRLREGAPALDDHHAWVALTVAQLVEAGDHVVVLGEVAAAEAGERAPLTYWQRTFGTHRTS